MSPHEPQPIALCAKLDSAPCAVCDQALPAGWLGTVCYDCDTNHYQLFGIHLGGHTCQCAACRADAETRALLVYLARETRHAHNREAQRKTANRRSQLYREARAAARAAEERQFAAARLVKGEAIIEEPHGECSQCQRVMPLVAVELNYRDEEPQRRVRMMCRDGCAIGYTKMRQNRYAAAAAGGYRID